MKKLIILFLLFSLLTLNVSAEEYEAKNLDGKKITLCTQWSEDFDTQTYTFSVWIRDGSDSNDDERVDTATDVNYFRNNTLNEAKDIISGGSLVVPNDVEYITFNAGITDIIDKPNTRYVCTGKITKNVGTIDETPILLIPLLMSLVMITWIKKNKNN